MCIRDRLSHILILNKIKCVIGGNYGFPACEIIDPGKDGVIILELSSYQLDGAKKISLNEELSRIIPVLKEIKYNFKELIISIDTYRSIVAERTLDLGANIINDISAGNLDNNMLKVVSDFKCPYIMMHMKGNPETMQKHPNYDNPTKEIINYLAKRIKKAVEYLSLIHI